MPTPLIQVRADDFAELEQLLRLGLNWTGYRGTAERGLAILAAALADSGRAGVVPGGPDDEPADDESNPVSFDM
jgi:hypothetical protein